VRDRGSVGQNKSAFVCVRVASDNDSNKKNKAKIPRVGLAHFACGCYGNFGVVSRRRDRDRASGVSP